MTKQELNLTLLSPRGFCAGVSRAIEIVEKALEKYGAPIYVKHQIVHNKRVLSDLSQKGVIFTDDVSNLKEGDIIIFNAHGVTKDFEELVKEKKLHSIDATCPLVKKVHKESEKYENAKKNIIAIGHKNHPEIIATLSRINGDYIILETVEDAKNTTFEEGIDYAIITQTTLSIDYILEITNVLKNKIANLEVPKHICYATTNRQLAIKSSLDGVDGLLIIGSQNSSNSNRLKEIGINNSIKSFLIDAAEDIPFEEIKNMKNLTISSGASTPEILVEEIVSKIKEKFNTVIINSEVLKENTKFISPKI